MKDINLNGFKAISNFSDYLISQDGRIYSNRSRKFLKLNPEKRGYVPVSLVDDGGNIKCKKLHRLVWETFNGPIPDGYEINHKNEIRNDNRLENLELLTHKENLNYGNHNEKLKDSLKLVVKRGGECNFSKPICVYSVKEGSVYNFSSRIELAQFFEDSKRHLIYKMYEKPSKDGSFELNGTLLKERNIFP